MNARKMCTQRKIRSELNAILPKSDNLHKKVGFHKAYIAFNAHFNFNVIQILFVNLIFFFLNLFFLFY